MAEEPNVAVSNPAPTQEKKEMSDGEVVGQIQERLTKDLKEAPEFQGETPEVQAKRADAERSLTIFDRVMFRLNAKDATPKTVPEILQDLGSEAKYLAEHARSDAKRQEYEAEVKLTTDWGKSYEQKKQGQATTPAPAASTGGEPAAAVVTESTTVVTPEVSSQAQAPVANTEAAGTPGANASAEPLKMDVAAQIEAALNEGYGGEPVMAPNVVIAGGAMEAAPAEMQPVGAASMGAEAVAMPTGAQPIGAAPMEAQPPVAQAASPMT